MLVSVKLSGGAARADSRIASILPDVTSKTISPFWYLRRQILPVRYGASRGDPKGLSKLHN